MSGCNSGIYSAARMLYTLAKNGQAPKFFGEVSESGVPRNSIVTTIACLLLGVFFNVIAPNSKLFVYIYSASILPGMVPWFALAFSQFKFRERWKNDINDHPFKSPLFPISNYITIIFLSLVLIGMWFNPDTHMSLIVGAVFLMIVIAGYYVFGIRKKEALPDSEDTLEAAK